MNLHLLVRLVGQRLLGVRRVFFTHGGNVERGAGPLELSFGTAGTVLLDVGGDGETLLIQDQPWRDPFDEQPLSAENQKWIVEHGKWTAFHVSDDAPYSALVRKPLNSVKALKAAGGNICGVRLGFGSVVLDFVGIADEALMFFEEQDDLRLAVLKVFVGEELVNSESSNQSGRNRDP